ncbi:hypothetical protein OC846_001237 [Tilletia horrida]|uniref:Phosducin domain-containing protein n=1 Tax=Tilletia horrida TaxID=155126 RepID=A0AAN6GSY6_9BASI|nr:hypothetical protein OC846_001237 [Tilletia horrida]
MADPLEDLVLNGGADARKTAAELPGIEHSRRGPQDDKADDNVDADDDAHEEELDDGQDYDDGYDRQTSHPSSDRIPELGPGGAARNTGPKGVITDQRQRAQANAQAQREKNRAINTALQRKALTALTADEEDRLRKLELREQDSDDDGHGTRGKDRGSSNDRVDPVAAADFAARERRREERIAELQREAERKRAIMLGTPLSPASAQPAQSKDVWFGHLREVDAAGFVRATDEERDDVPVVAHLYEKHVPACRVLTAALASLARQYPHTKFIQVRALAVGYGLTEEEEDFLVEEDLGRGEEEDHHDEAAAMEKFEALKAKVEVILPTLHIYQGGDLVANLVRPDLDETWRGGRESNIRDLLALHSAISDNRESQGPPAVARRLGQQQESDDDDT